MNIFILLKLVMRYLILKFYQVDSTEKIEIDKSHMYKVGKIDGYIRRFLNVFSTKKKMIQATIDKKISMILFCLVWTFLEKEDSQIMLNPLHQYSTGVLFPRLLKIGSDGSTDEQDQKAPLTFQAKMKMK